jgi:CheY-like chemotaxis protein
MPLNKTDLILHIENEPDDVFIVRRAFKKVGIDNPSVHVDNGEMAVDYLSGCAPITDKTGNILPALILLDLSMPRMGGIEVLRWIRSQPIIKRIIVVVLTSSQNQDDITAAYENGANGYLVKPVGAPEFQAVLSSLKAFWLETNQGPHY